MTTLDKILQEKTIKLARIVRASYIEHVVRLFEGKSNKYSSVESALQDFAQRLGLDNNELGQLKKQAFIKMAQLEQQHTLNKLEDEGITDPKAVSYMAKQKNKHTDNTSSPFSLNKQKAAPLIEELKKRHPQEEAPGVEDQTNELGSSLSGGSFASLGNDALRKIAEEFGKILPFGGPSQEALEDLKSELGEIDLDTPYKAARFGFNFTNLQGGFPKPNTPIKVTTYQYSFLKDNFVKIINDDLKKHLAQEMPFDQWIAFLEEKIKSKEIHHTEGWGLVDKLKKMQRQLFGDETTAPYSIDETAKRVPTQVRNILKWFPVSYREKILRMLAEGKYRHILTEASGREHANVFPTSYARSSFVLMDSFAPYSAISIKPDKDLLKALLTSVVTNKKQEYSNDEFKTLLDSLGIKYTEKPASREYQAMNLHSKVQIKVENSKNSSYKPLTFDKEAVDVNDKEALLEKFNDHLFNAIREDLPLAYETQPDGSTKELKLSDLGGAKKDLTLSSISHKDEVGNEVDVPNPKAGMHASFEGSISQKSKPAEGPKNIPTGISFEDMSPTAKPKEKKEKEKSTAPTGDFDFSDMLEKLKAKKLKGLGSVLNILQKYASSGLWMDGKGRSFDSEENLRKTLESEMIQESASSIVDKAVQMSMSGLTSAPESPISKQPRVIEEAEEDKLPLAANTILRLRIVASKTHNSHLKTKINQIINKNKEVSVRLRRFALRVEASRAEQLVNRVSPDFIQAVKKLDASDVKKLLRQFVPLDFVALLQKENPQAFEQVLRGAVSAQLSSDQHKKWIEELIGTGLFEDKEDAIGETYAAMLNDDPKRRGILSQLLLDGSYSDAFQYARKDQPALRLSIKQNLAPLSSDNGLVVPFCPIDKKLGIEHPLWNASTEGGKLEFIQGVDSSGRCITKEVLSKMSQEEFEQLKKTNEGLSPEQTKSIASGARTLEYEDGQVVLRCTFHARLPKFRNFLGYKTRQALKAVLDPERKKMGRNIPPAKYKRRNELEAKKKAGTLTPTEKGELYSLEEYFKKKHVDFVYNPSSLDAPAGDDEGRSQHEVVEIKDLADVSQEDLNTAKFELERRLGAKEFKVLETIAEKVPLGTLMSKLQAVMNLSSKDPKKQVVEKEIVQESFRVAQKFFGEDASETNKCNTCGQALAKDATSCNQATEMRKALATNYKQSPDMDQFDKFMNQIDPKALEHYKKSGLSTKMNALYSGLEVTEDDLDLDLDLSAFESYKEETPKTTKKLNEKELRDVIEKSLSDQQRAAYIGADASSANVNEADIAKVDQLATLIRKMMQDVFQQELEDDLALYLVGAGVG